MPFEEYLSKNTMTVFINIIECISMRMYNTYNHRENNVLHEICDDNFFR